MVGQVADDELGTECGHKLGPLVQAADEGPHRDAALTQPADHIGAGTAVTPWSRP